LIAALTVMSCQSTKKVSDKEITKETGMNMKVPFTLAKNYFIKNTLEDKPAFVEKLQMKKDLRSFWCSGNHE
jgi:hypothetical protein